MNNSFDFNAPQFFDFSQNNTDHDKVDEYFERDHENDKDPLGMVEIDFFTTDQSETRNPNFRRSMSVGDLNYLQALEVPLTSETPECELSPVTNLKKMGSFASLDGNSLDSKENKLISSKPSKSVSKESINRLAQPKRRQFSSNQDLSSNNYMPVAEYIDKFQNSTPERFRRTIRTDGSSKLPCKWKTTIPQSPYLISKQRSRPVYALSHDQKEKQEFEEAQKFKIKAHAVNKRVLSGPVKPTVQVQKKPVTVPQPFELSAPSKKIAESPKKNHYEFHAKPVPKSLHQLPKLKAPKLPVTEPQTPKFMKNLPKQPTKPPKVEEEQKARPRMTTVLPFSFEMRDIYMRKKNRQELLDRVKEQERKAREFHARPVPKAVLDSSKNINSGMKHGSFKRSESQRSLTGSDTSKSNEQLNCPFKARPATVLVKEPFVPKKLDKPLTEIQQFNLNTEIRAKNREAFDQFIKEREDQLAMQKMMDEVKRIQEEEEEKNRLRKLTEYKAQPIKKYKEVVIQPSGKVTEPVSPTFLTDKFHPPKSRRDNKENVLD